MTETASVLVQARTEGGLTAPPVGSPRLPADASIPPLRDLAATVDANKPEIRELPAASVGLADRPPPNVAFLHVHAHALENDRWAFSLLGTSSVASLPSSKPRARPRLVLANLAQDVNPTDSRLPSEVIAVIR